MRRFWLLVVPFTATACAFHSVAGGQIPRARPPVESVLQTELMYHVQATGASQASEALVDGAIRGSLVTARAMSDSSPPGSGHFLSVRLHEQAPGPLRRLWVVGSAVVGCVAPAVASTTYVFEVDVFQEGQPVGEYRYQDHVRRWCLFFPYFLAVRDGDPERTTASARDEVVGNLVDTFLNDFSRDFLQGSNEVTAAAGGAP